MAVFCSEPDLKRYIDNAVEVDPDRPVLVDKYMDRADELDVDALADKDGNVTICGIMQHIEQAGVHSGTPYTCMSTSSNFGNTSPASSSTTYKTHCQTHVCWGDKPMCHAAGTAVLLYWLQEPCCSLLRYLEIVHVC